MSCRLAPTATKPIGTPWASVERAAFLTPHLARWVDRAPFFSPRAALSSSPHPCSASSNRSPSNHQTVPPRLSTTSEKPRRLPRLGTDHAPWNGDTTRWRPRLPLTPRPQHVENGIGTLPIRVPVASLRRSDGGCDASGARARALPTTLIGHPKSCGYFVHRCPLLFLACLSHKEQHSKI